MNAINTAAVDAISPTGWLIGFPSLFISVRHWLPEQAIRIPLLSVLPCLQDQKFVTTSLYLIVLVAAVMMWILCALRCLLATAL